MARALFALRDALVRPAPAWAWWVAVSCVMACFVLACWAFAYPLSYCDSPGWAPAYLARLLDADPLVGGKQRGVLIPAWFQHWGALSIASGFGNLIGCMQAVALGSTAMLVLLRLRSKLSRIELLLLPALVLSGLRLAIYSQTLLSESVVIPLVVSVALWLMRAGTPSLRQCAGVSALAALAANARIENLLLVALVLGRIATDRSSFRDRARRLGLALGVAVALLLTLAQLSQPVRGEPIGSVMIVAEWMRFSEPPRTALARLLHFDLVDRLAAETATAPISHIYDGLAPARRLFGSPAAPGGLEIARLLAYQLANRPFAVLADRLRTLADLHASGYAAFWPTYRPWSTFYSPYDQVFARWTPAQLEQARYSCPGFARAQELHYGRLALRSESAVRALRRFHEAAEGYARWVLRPWFWVAIPASLYLLSRRHGGTPYAWLLALLLASLVLRAAFVCADERYQLPVDLLVAAWLVLTLRYSIGAATATAEER